jgi:hypothetical protein
LSLYAKLGFQVRDLLACMQGPPPTADNPGYRVRAAAAEDLPACAALCQRVHGHERTGDVSEAIAARTALVVEHGGRITGYASGLAFFNHAVGESNEDLKALITTARAFGGPGILVPTTNPELFEWCLNQGLQIVQLMTLMSIGLYSTPRGAYLPSIVY